MIQLQPHQLAAIEKLSNGKILCGGVGSGKSLTSLGYYFEKVFSDSPETAIYVITTAKKRNDGDWVDEFAKAAQIASQEVSGTVVVDSWNNINKYKEVKNAFFIFDEQRLVGSGAWTKAFLQIAKANQWLLLSATPGDTWLDYIPVFIANGFYKNRTEFKRKHVVYNSYTKYPKVDRYVDTKELVRNRNKVLVMMPYTRHTRRHLHDIPVDYDQELYWQATKQRWNVYTQEPQKDIAEMFRVTRRIANSDPSRMYAVRALLEKHPKLIIFYNFDYELEILREGLTEWSRETTLSAPNTSLMERTNGRPSTTEKEVSNERSVVSAESLDTTTPKSEWSGTSFDPSWPTSEKELKLQNEMKLRMAQSDFLMKERRNVNTESMSGRPSLTDSDGKSPSSAASAESDLRPERSSKSSSETPPTSSGSGSKNSSTSTTNAKEPKSPTSPLSPTTPMSRLAPPVEESTPSITIAEYNGHKHENVPTSDSWVYLVQYTAGSEGWNCIETDAICFYSLNYSWRLFEQAQGRIDRMNTKFVDLHYYILRSRSSIDKGISRSVLNKKDFNERGFTLAA